MVGWSDKTKLILISTLVEVVVEVDEVEVQLLFRVGGWWVGGRIKQN